MKNQIIKKNYEGGQVMLTIVVFFMFASMTIVFGVINPILKQVAMSNNLVYSNGSYYLAHSALEDVYYRLRTAKEVSSTETLSLNGGETTTTVVDTGVGKEITSGAEVKDNFRKMKANLVYGTGISFHYGVQSGRGGFYLENSSSVTGNIYSGGPVVGDGNIIDGDVVSSGPDGIINDVYITGNALAHTILDSTIGKNAFYVTLTNSSVGETSYPNSPDQPDVPLPISDEQIAEWQDHAESGGIVSCTNGTYTIQSNVTIGPKKIPCDLLIKGSGVQVTIAGPIWVTGNITTQVSPTIKMAASLGSSNVAIIADNPSNTSGSGIIDIGQNTQFEGSGSPNSFVFMISQNNSAELGGNTNAIVMGQGASALVAYASHGQVTLEQSVGVKEVTAYKIILQNTANVVYDTGLPSVLFDGGPSGGYDVFFWREVE